MEATELRIGNFYQWTVSHGTAIEQIKDGADIDRFMRNPLLREPVPLTEDWLLKFGFEKLGKFERNVIDFETIYNIQALCGRLSSVCFYEKPNESYWYFKYGFSDIYTKPELQYVHQLQNLYFALTGEELEIK